MFHDQRALIQYTPCRAKKKVEVHELKLKTALFIKKLWEQKIDGERYLLHTDVGGPYQHAITSRRQSEVTGRMVEKTDRVPRLTNAVNLPPQSLLDNELVASADAVYLDLPGKFWDKLLEPNHRHLVWLKNKFGGALPCYPHVAHTVSIMGSLGPEAVRKQEERGPVWGYTFDIIQFQGRNLTKNGQLARRRFLASIYEKIDPENGLILMPCWQGLTIDEIETLFNLITDIEGEGLIGKSQDDEYNAAQAWWKLKRDYPGDVVYTGVSKEGEEGKTGKMLGMAASLEIGVFHNGALIPIGWCSAIRDGLHRLQTPEEHMRDNAGHAIEVRHNGLQKEPSHPLGYTLRHPRWRRDREDKNPTDCTWATLFAEASKKLG